MRRVCAGDEVLSEAACSLKKVKRLKGKGKNTFSSLPAPCPSPVHTLAWLLLLSLLLSLLCCVMPGLLLLLRPLPHAADRFVCMAAAPQGHPAAAGAAAGGSGAAGGGSEELGSRKGPQCGGEEAVSGVLPCRRNIKHVAARPTAALFLAPFVLPGRPLQDAPRLPLRVHTPLD